MDKQQEFLWIVQTVLLANATNLSASPEVDRYRHLISGTGIFGLADDALYASNRIPEPLNAAEAAHQFLSWVLDDWREDGATLPSWFARN